MKTPFLLRACATSTLVAALLTLPARPAFADLALPPRPTATPPPTPLAAPAPASTPESAKLVAGIEAVHFALVQATDRLRGAVTNTHGGLVEKARTDLPPALAAATAALDFAHANPAAASSPALVSPAGDAILARLNALPPPADNKQPYMYRALAALKAALGSLQALDGGDLGGAREKIIASVAQTADDVIAGIKYADSHPAPTAGTATASARGSAGQGNLGPDAILAASVAGITLRDPKASASRALALVRDLRADTAYASPVAHPALLSELNVIESLTKAIQSDDGTDATATAKLQHDLVLALAQTRARANALATDRAESPDAQTKSQRLAEDLKAILTN